MQVGQDGGKPFGIRQFCMETKPLGYGSIHGVLKGGVSHQFLEVQIIQECVCISPPMLGSSKDLNILLVEVHNLNTKLRIRISTDLIAARELACMYTLSFFGFADSVSRWGIGHSSRCACQCSGRLPHGERIV